MKFSSWIRSSFGLLLLLGTSSTLAERYPVGDPGAVSTVLEADVPAVSEADVLKKFHEYLGTSGGTELNVTSEPLRLNKRATLPADRIFSDPPSGILGDPNQCDNSMRFITKGLFFNSGTTAIGFSAQDPNGDYHHFFTASLVRAADVNAVNIITNPNFVNLISYTVSGPGSAFYESFPDRLHIQSQAGIESVTQSGIAVVPLELYTVSFYFECHTSGNNIGFVTLDGIQITPFLLHLDPTTDSGPLNNDGRTNIPAPILAGTAPPLSTVVIIVNGVAVGVATSLADGTFTYQLPILSGENSVSATTFFYDQFYSSPLATPITVIIDPALSINLQSASDDGVPGDGVTSQQTLTFFGSGPINSVLTFSDNGLQYTTISDASGNWVFTVQTTIGSHNFQIADLVNVYSDDPPAELVITVVAVPDPPLLLGLSSDSDTGITGDLQTSNAVPTITGTATPGASVYLTENNINIGFGTADNSGAFSITVLVPFPLGPHAIIGYQVPSNGISSGASSELIINIVLEAPELLQITPDTDTGTVGDLETANVNPTVVGTGLPSGQITLFESGAVVGSAVSDGSGSFSVTVVTLPGPGQYTFLAKQASQGFDSDLSNALTVTILPQPPVLLGLTLDSDTGTPGDLQTSDTTPTIIGTASPSALLVLFLGNQQIGTGTAEPSGDFMVTTSVLGPPGVYAITARQTVLGFQSELSQPFTITILPDAPILDGVDPNPGSDGNGIPLTSSRTPAIEGSGLSNANIIIFEGNRIAGSGQTDSNGRFSITTNTQLSLGVHTFTAVAWTFEGLMSLRSLPFSIDVVDPEPSSSSIEVQSSTVDVISSTSELSTELPSMTVSSIPAETLASSADISSLSIESSITSDISSTETQASSVSETFSSGLTSGIPETSSGISSLTSETVQTPLFEPTSTFAESTQVTTTTSAEFSNTASISAELTDSGSNQPSSIATATPAVSTASSFSQGQETSGSTGSVSFLSSEPLSSTEPTQTVSIVETASNVPQTTDQEPSAPATSESLVSSSIAIGTAVITVSLLPTSTEETTLQASTVGISSDIVVESPSSLMGTTTPPFPTTTPDFSSISMRFSNSSSADVPLSSTAVFSNLPTATDIISLPATTLSSLFASSEPSSTIQVPTLSGSISTALGPSTPSSTASVSFFLTLQFPAGVKRRQNQGSTYLSLIDDQLIATQSCVEQPPAELTIDNGRLQSVSGSVVAVASSLLVSPGYSSLQFDATPDPADIQTTFAFDPVSQDLTWSNPAFLNSEAQFCLLGNVLQASYTVLVASIPGCIPVVLLPSTDVCSAVPSSSLSIIPGSASLESTAFPPSISATQPIVTGTATSTGGVALTSDISGIVIGIEITIQITIIYITIEINGNLINTTTKASQTYTSPLVASSSTYVDTSIIGGVTKYITTTIACGICQNKNAIPGEITVYQVVTVDPSCTTSVSPVVESVKPCAKCQAVVPDTAVGKGDQNPAGVPQEKIQLAPLAPAKDDQVVQTQAEYPQESGKSAGKATDAGPVSTLVPDTSKTATSESPAVYTGQASTVGPSLVFSVSVGLAMLYWSH